MEKRKVIFSKYSNVNVLLQKEYRSQHFEEDTICLRQAELTLPCTRKIVAGRDFLVVLKEP